MNRDKPSRETICINYDFNIYETPKTSCLKEAALNRDSPSCRHLRQPDNTRACPVLLHAIPAVRVKNAVLRSVRVIRRTVVRAEIVSLMFVLSGGEQAGLECSVFCLFQPKGGEVFVT